MKRETIDVGRRDEAEKPARQLGSGFDSPPFQMGQSTSPSQQFGSGDGRLAIQFGDWA